MRENTKIYFDSFPYIKRTQILEIISQWTQVSICSTQSISELLVHYNDVIMSAIPSHMTRLTIVHSIVYSDADQRKHQSCASLAFVRGIHRGPVNSPHKWPVTRNMFPFDDVIMCLATRGARALAAALLTQSTRTFLLQHQKVISLAPGKLQWNFE